MVYGDREALTAVVFYWVIFRFFARPEPLQVEP